MVNKIRVIDLTQDNIGESPCCGIKNIEHKGHKRKTNWLKTYLNKGLKAKVLWTEDNRQMGYIEYLPGKYAWRGIEADKYMVIHCIWMFFKRYQRKGYGKLLIQASIDDAKRAKMKGVAVVARNSPWLASRGLFLKQGFEIVDTALPDYELLVRKFDKSAADPRFKNNWDKKLKKYDKGLTIVRSDQCPHVAKFADDISAMAEKTYKIKPRVVELNTYQDAQNSPTPYAVFAVIYDGRLLADRQISGSSFRKIMSKILQ